MIFIMFLAIVASIYVVSFVIKNHKEKIVFDALLLLSINNEKTSVTCENCRYFIVEGTHNGVYGTCVKLSDKPSRKSTNHCRIKESDNELS